MADNPLRLAQRLGIRAVNDLGVLFGRLGNTDHPKSQTLVAYRVANRALAEILKNGGGLADISDITRQLEASVRPAITNVLHDAASQGHTNAARQLILYKISPPDDIQNPAILVSAAYNVIDATLQRQASALVALYLSGSDDSLMIGDDTRQGVLRASEIVMSAAFWAASLWWKAFSQTADRAGGGFSKQAVAALDARTTDCCLRVHGQIQPLDAPFHLTGTPRFADEIDWPPFHYWCRTSGVLYQATYDDGLTERMRDSAAQVLAERKAGIVKDRHPADAFI